MEIEKHENGTYVKEEAVGGAHCKWFQLQLPLPLPVIHHSSIRVSSFFLNDDYLFLLGRLLRKSFPLGFFFR